MSIIRWSHMLSDHEVINLNDYSVEVTYKKDGEFVTNSYSFENYTSNCSYEIRKILNDIEDEIVRTKGKKENWDEDTLAFFNKIRKKILNLSNSVARLPVCLKGPIPVSDVLNSVIENSL